MIKRIISLTVVVSSLLIGHADAQTANYTESSTGFSFIGLEEGGQPSPWMCTGPSLWMVTPGTVQWSASNTINWHFSSPGEWTRSRPNGFFNGLRPLYKRESPSNCSSNTNYTSFILSGEERFIILPAGLYGVFAFYNLGVGEWEHIGLEQGLRAFPISWTVSGTIE